MVAIKHKANLDGLKELNKAFGEKMKARVGVLSGTNARTPVDGEGSGTTNAEIGAVHEFGSITKNIPARSWLRMPIQAKAKEIQGMVFKNKDKIEKGLSDGDPAVFYDSLAVSAISYIQLAFETHGFGQWKPNAPSTVKQKGSSSPLIDSSQLREAVTWEVKKVNG